MELPEWVSEVKQEREWKKMMVECVWKRMGEGREREKERERERGQERRREREQERGREKESLSRRFLQSA